MHLRVICLIILILFPLSIKTGKTQDYPLPKELQLGPGTSQTIINGEQVKIISIVLDDFKKTKIIPQRLKKIENYDFVFSANASHVSVFFRPKPDSSYPVGGGNKNGVEAYYKLDRKNCKITNKILFQ